jgi:hypothetical protein
MTRSFLSLELLGRPRWAGKSMLFSAAVPDRGLPARADRGLCTPRDPGRRPKSLCFQLFVTFWPAAFASAVGAATINAPTCSSTDVQTAINSAAAGDTVVIPNGTCAWTSGVTINGKAVKVQGGGAGRVIAYSLTPLTIGNGSKTLTVASTRVDGALSISNGQTLRISENGFRQNFLEGTVTSYSAGTLSMNITSSGGTIGTAGPPNTMKSNGKRWLISTMASTVLTNNAGSNTLFALTEATGGKIEVAGIKFGAGTGSGNVFYLKRTTNGKPILLHDFRIEQVGNVTQTAIDGNTSRGVMWNCSIDSSPFAASNTQAFRTKDANGTAMASSWTTPSTIGTADTAGDGNFYIEDCDFHAYMGFMDLDDNSRTVFRYNFLNNAGGASHGADTSSYGLRHFEFYNNVGIFQSYGDGTTANMNWWQFVRGGTFVIHGNSLQQISSVDWGSKPDITLAVENLSRNAGPHAGWGHGGTPGQYYPAPRQIGMGRVTGGGSAAGPQLSAPTNFSGSADAFTYVGDSEPAYLWNNKRTIGGTNVALVVGYAVAYTDVPDADKQQNYVVSGRDYFNTAGTAKAGYTPYVYPHLLRSGGTTPTLPAPANLRVTP